MNEGKYDQVTKTMTPTSTNTANLSLQERLSALTKSSNNWQKRVKKDGCVLSNDTPRRLRVLGKPPLPVGKENVSTGVTVSDRLLPIGHLQNIDKGLETFFPHDELNAPKVSVDIDLDCVAKTEFLVTPRRPRVRAVSRRKVVDDRILQIDPNKVTVEEVVVDSVVRIVDEGGEVATSARLGLQAVEDYTNAKHSLKQHEDVSPYPERMLIQIRGEKKVDVRLVAPKATSLVDSAVFLLVTSTRLLKYEGEDSNILEKTKASQITIEITTKSDLHCSAKRVETVSKGYLSQFLGGEDDLDRTHTAVGYFETFAHQVNLVLRVTKDYKTQSVIKGQRVSYALLKASETLIFDFGSEIYVWSGRNACKTSSKYALEYAEQLRKTVVPNSLFVLGEDFKSCRSDWILLRKVFQGVQDVLFSSKFFDWATNETKLYGSPMTPIAKTYLPTSAKRDDLDGARRLATSISNVPPVVPSIILEDYEIDRNMKDVVTEDIKFWVLAGEELQQIDATNVLVDHKCYVIKWQYRVQKSGIRRLKTGEEHDKETGRERFAYFYWIGKRTTSKQQGLCALKLSHMDKAKFPHVRILQGQESALFLQLFGGRLIIRNEAFTGDLLFLVAGASQKEAHLIQIDSNQPLRSHGVYINLSKTPQIVAGCDCRDLVVKMSLTLVKELQTSDDNKSVEVVIQGDNQEDKWITCAGRTRCPRFYRIYETEVNELICPQYSEDLDFPIEQTSLSDTVLVDSGEKLFIWSEQPPTTLVLRAAENFWMRRKGPATVIQKYSEPEEFQALFSQWVPWDTLTTSEELEVVPTFSPPRKLAEVVEEHSRCYSLDYLKNRSDLPPGMNLQFLEQYLDDPEFLRVFNMEKTAFAQLPVWKQIRLRKQVGLF